MKSLGQLLDDPQVVRNSHSAGMVLSLNITECGELMSRIIDNFNPLGDENLNLVKASAFLAVKSHCDILLQDLVRNI